LNIKFSTKPNWLLLIVSALLFIMIFLPWWSSPSVNLGSFGVIGGGSVNGFHSGGILTFLAALAGIALSFLEISNAKYRAYMIMGIGGLALLGALIAFASYSGLGFSIGFGRILALIFSIALIAVGFLDYRGIDLWAKMKASSAKSSSPPPASPPPAK
jgi:hypothetical protein